MMENAKKILFDLIEDINENDAFELIDFISYLKSKREKSFSSDLQELSESSLSFWDNEVDDEVWNDL